MSILEFDMERDMRLIRRDERDIGREEGRILGEQMGRKELQEQLTTSFVLDNLKNRNSVETIVENLVKWFQVQQDEAIQLVAKLKNETVV